MREFEQVGRDRERSRLGRVAIDVAATIGYDAMSATDIAAAAGVGRRTLSRFFPDKQAAFEYGYREVTAQLRTAVQLAYDGGSTPRERAEECLRVIAAFLACDPARAEALVIHGHAAGSVVAGVHRETMQRMTELIRRNAAGMVPPDRDARLLAETVAGGIYQVVHARVAQGEVRELPASVAAWSMIAMAPYAAIAEHTAMAPCVAITERAASPMGHEGVAVPGEVVGRSTEPRTVVGHGRVRR